MKFTRDQKAEAFDKLPKELKKIVMGDVLTEALQKIGLENKLPIDKVGALGELVITTILDLNQREDFEKNAQMDLGVDRDRAALVTESVNKNIFLKIRELLRQEEEREVSEMTEDRVTQPETEITEKKNRIETSQESNYSDMGRDSILAEIENPTPTIHPISAADQTLPGPAKPREIMTVPEKTPTKEAKEAVARDFVAGKLTETVNLPSQTVTVTPKEVSTPPSKPKYNADPYREPLS